MISIIAAMDEKRGIGKNNGLLFRIPQDFERMKRLTMGHPLVMGRRTFESLGRKLPGRSHIVITRDPSSLEGLNYAPDEILGSLEEGLQLAKTKDGHDEIFIFGGGQVFKEAIEKGLVDRLYLTIVQGDFGADTFFPDYSKFDRVIKEQSGESRSAGSGQVGEYKYTFLDLEKS